MRTPRTRQRDLQTYTRYFNQFGINYHSDAFIERYDYFSDYLSDNFSTFNPCFHVQTTQTCTGLIREEFGFNTVRTHIFSHPLNEEAADIFSACFDAALERLDFKLDFQKNNDFELLSLIGELDDLIATFTVKFWKSLTYGAFNWGVLPLISDIRSLSSSFSDVFDGGILSAIQKFNSRTSSTYTISIDSDSLSVPSVNGMKFSFKGKLRLHGSHFLSVPPSPTTALALFADELGVHPDLRTIWDLLPLSFILDYFLPIGDILESVHPRGWFRPNMSFQGKASLSGELTLYTRQSVSFSLIEHPLLSKHRCFSRRENIVSDLSYTDLGLPNDYKFGLSLRQLFNLGYIAKSMF